MASPMPRECLKADKLNAISVDENLDYETPSCVNLQ